MKHRIVRIPKRSGGHRKIYIPDEELKRWLTGKLPFIRLLAEGSDKHRVQHAFFRGRSPVTNAAQHVGFDYTLSMDLKDFFDSVTLNNVLNAMLSMENHGSWKVDVPYTTTIGADIVLGSEASRRSGVPEGRFNMNTMFADGHVPQGYSTSPFLANLAGSRLDNQIMEHQVKGRFTNFVYTRYADDLTFSYNSREMGDWLEDEVKRLVADIGWRVNNKKTERYHAKGGRRIITGVAVDKGAIYPTKRVRRRTRAIAHQIENGFSRRALKQINRRRVERKRQGKDTVPVKGSAIMQLQGLTEWANLKTPRRLDESVNMRGSVRPRLNLAGQKITPKTNHERKLS